MGKEKPVKIIEVNAGNVEQTGFFCYMSKRKTAGFRRKLDWLKERFGEGLKIKMLELPNRGFIEYIPGEYAWRAVNAKGYMFIHCLWVVGKSKGKGYSSLLLKECIKDAQKAQMKGAAMVTSEGVWVAGKKVLLKHGFESVAQAPPSFDLMVKKFGKARPPSFVDDWDKKAAKHKKGLTIFRSDQCPYIEDATNTLTDAADELGIKCKVIELKTAKQLRELSPSPYGTLNVVYNGKLLSYHYLLKKDFVKALGKLDG
ncbi:GNAT family N-acetyltransferase [Planctomycetota bacterium]